MSWLITSKQKTLNGTLTIGQFVGGGYFAGYISHTANGNPTHALIVAPNAQGSSGKSWALNQTAADGINYSTTTIGTTTPPAAKDYDGLSNMALMNAIGISNFPAAEFCKNLTIGGFTDWYLPATFELEIAYFNLKPGKGDNLTNIGNNPYSVPRRDSNYSLTTPGQTVVEAFKIGGAEAFATSNYYNASTEFNASVGAFRYFYNGSQAFTKTWVANTRAFRKIAL